MQAGYSFVFVDAGWVQFCVVAAGWVQYCVCCCNLGIVLCLLLQVG